MNPAPGFHMISNATACCSFRKQFLREEYRSLPEGSQIPPRITETHPQHFGSVWNVVKSTADRLFSMISPNLLKIALS